MQFFFLAIVLFTAINISANTTCSEVDLTKSTVGSRLGVQTEGFCYAHSAAELAYAATGKQTAPLHAAITFNANYRSKKRELGDNEHPVGGYTFETLEALKKKGWIADRYCVNSMGNDDYALSIFYLSYPEKIKAQSIVPSYPKDKCLPMPNFNSEISATQQIQTLFMSTEKIVEGITDGGCTGDNRVSLKDTQFCKLPNPDVPMHFFDKKNNQPYSEVIARGINTGLLLGSPVEIGFDEKTLSNNKVVDAGHSALITGRKMINGSCHYIVRNYWETPCSPHWKKDFKQILCGDENPGIIPDDSFAIPVGMAHGAVEAITFASKGPKIKPVSDVFDSLSMTGKALLLSAKCTQ